MVNDEYLRHPASINEGGLFHPPASINEGGLSAEGESMIQQIKPQRNRFCYTNRYNEMYKIGKLERAILEVLATPYDLPEPSGAVSSYPLIGSDIKGLARRIYRGETWLADYGNVVSWTLSPAAQVAISRALNSLHAKRLVAKLPPQRDELGYIADRRVFNPEVRYTVYPHNTKYWWLLASQLRDIEDGQ